MGKWLIASDIHGSAHYCRVLLNHFTLEEADRLLLLGDLLYHGPRNPLPMGYDTFETTRLLNGVRNKLLCVRGNCDSEVDQMVLQFPMMADYTVLPAGRRTLFATHGHLYGEETPPPLRAGDILLNGHTHMPACVDHPEFLYLNPGSISMPKEDSPHSCMIWEEGHFLWKNLENWETYLEYSM